MWIHSMLHRLGVVPHFFWRRDRSHRSWRNVVNHQIQAWYRSRWLRYLIRASFFRSFWQRIFWNWSGACAVLDPACPLGTNRIRPRARCRGHAETLAKRLLASVFFWREGMPTPSPPHARAPSTEAPVDYERLANVGLRWLRPIRAHHIYFFS